MFELVYDQLATLPIPEKNALRLRQQIVQLLLRHSDTLLLSCKCDLSISWPIRLCPERVDRKSHAMLRSATLLLNLHLDQDALRTHPSRLETSRGMINAPDNRRSRSPNSKQGRSTVDIDSTDGAGPPLPNRKYAADGDDFDTALSSSVQTAQRQDEIILAPAACPHEATAEEEFAPATTAAGSTATAVTAASTEPSGLKWITEPDGPKSEQLISSRQQLSLARDSESDNRGGRNGSPSPSLQRTMLPLPLRSPLLPPPPPPQQAPNTTGSTFSGGGSTGMRDLDGCWVWYTDDSATEADIESMASVASVDSREDDLEAAASTDSEVASTASSTGGTSSIASGDSSRGRLGGRDLFLSSCSKKTWNEEGEEDLLLGLSLARARMTAGKAACSCKETSCFCRFIGCLAAPSQRSPAAAQHPSRAPPPLARSELDPRDKALVLAINRMATGGRGRRSEDEKIEDGKGQGAGVAAVAVVETGGFPGGAGKASNAGGSGGFKAGEVGAKAGSEVVLVAASAAAAALGEGDGWRVHPDCALEFAERFVRRDIALAGRVQAVRLLRGSTNNVFSVVVRCGGFRALYGWLGDVWERVRVHKLPRAGPPDWRSVGGRVYVEDLLGVLGRVPISVDMLRETEIARVAKKFRRLAERHDIESMITASNQLRAHLHAVVSRGVQEGLFFRNRVVGRSRAAGPGDHQRDVPHSNHSIPYPDRRPRSWNSKNILSWSANGGVAGGTGAFVGYGGTRGRASGAFIENNEGASFADRQEASSNGDYRGGGRATGAGSTAPHHHPYHPRYLSRFRIEYPVPALRSARLCGWRRRQSDEVDAPRAGSGAAGLREEDPSSVWDHGFASYHHQSISRRQDHEGGKGFCLGAEENGTKGGTTAGGGDGSGGCKDGKSGVYARGGAGRVRVSKTEPWVFDLSHSAGEEERRGRLALQPQRHASREGERRQQRHAGGRVDERWMRWQGIQQGDGGGGGRVIFPWREEGLSSASGKRASSTSLRTYGMEYLPENGSWEGRLDWWRRPLSPLLSDGRNAYYSAGDLPGGASGGSSSASGQLGLGSQLPTVPTFEESGTRVSWADYRGHRLAEVHEIEPCYSREDYALPGHVGWVAETSRRDMSKKEEQLLSQEDHERLAAATRESDALRERVYGGGTGGGGDSEGTISDSENSTTGDPDADFQNIGGGDAVGRDDGVDEEERLFGESVVKTTLSTTSEVSSNASASSGGCRDVDKSNEGGIVGRARACSGSDLTDHLQGGSRVGNLDDILACRHQQNSPSNSPQDSPQSSPQMSPQNSSSQNSSQSSPRDSPRDSKHGAGSRESGGSESGSSTLHSPQRFFSLTEDETSPPVSPLGIPTRRFTSPIGQRSPPGSPTVSSPGSSRSGSVADGNEGEGGSTRHRDVVPCPPVARSTWEKLSRAAHPCSPQESSSAPPSRWKVAPVEARFSAGQSPDGIIHFVVGTEDGADAQDNKRSTSRDIVSGSAGLRGRDGVGGDANGGALMSLPWKARRDARWKKGGRGGEGGRGGGEVVERFREDNVRAKLLPLENDEEEHTEERLGSRARAAILLGVNRTNASNAAKSSGSSSSSGGVGSKTRKALSSPRTSTGGGTEGRVACSRKRDRRERARTGRSTGRSIDNGGGEGGGNESGNGSSSGGGKNRLTDAAASSDGNLIVGKAASAPWSGSWTAGAPLRRGDNDGVSNAVCTDSSPDTSRQRASARRRIDDHGGGRKEEESGPGEGLE